jgi:hypothetical protein
MRFLSVLANFPLVPPRNSAVRPSEWITGNTEVILWVSAYGALPLRGGSGCFPVHRINILGPRIAEQQR